MPRDIALLVSYLDRLRDVEAIANQSLGGDKTEFSEFAVEVDSTLWRNRTVELYALDCRGLVLVEKLNISQRLDQSNRVHIVADVALLATGKVEWDINDQAMLHSTLLRFRRMEGESDTDN